MKPVPLRIETRPIPLGVCAVYDAIGTHCPEPATKVLSRQRQGGRGTVTVTVMACEQCAKNALSGAYGPGWKDATVDLYARYPSHAEMIYTREHPKDPEWPTSPSSREQPRFP